MPPLSDILFLAQWVATSDAAVDKPLYVLYVPYDKNWSSIIWNLLTK